MKRVRVFLLAACLMVAVLTACSDPNTVREGSSNLIAKPKFKPGDWVRSRLTGKCGIVHDRQEWRMQDWYEYRVRFAVTDSTFKDYDESTWAEGELDWCSPEPGGTQ